MHEQTQTLIVTLALIGFAILLQLAVPGATADTLSSVVITAVVARWLQQGAQQAAEKQADKITEAAAATVAASNGHRDK